MYRNISLSFFNQQNVQLTRVKKANRSQLRLMTSSQRQHKTVLSCQRCELGLTHSGTSNSESEVIH